MNESKKWQKKKLWSSVQRKEPRRRNWSQETNGATDFNFSSDVLVSVSDWEMSGDFHISVTETVEVRNANFKNNIFLIIGIYMCTSVYT